MNIKTGLGLASFISMAIVFTPAANVNAQLLEEVVVTAQKREESVQDIPIAISAFSADQMEKLNIKNMYDLEFTTPGLITGHSGGHALPYLRGIGGNATFPGADASTSTYVDGYYISYIKAVMQDLYDADRIEVLKGPQAILYGRNATGGAINYVTKKPNTEQLEGKVAIGYGSDDETELKGYITGPITDTLAFSVAGIIRERDSYIKYIGNVPGVDDDENYKGIRLKFLWQPNDRYQAELSAAHWKSESYEVFATMPLEGALTEGEILGATISTVDTYESISDLNNFDKTRQRMVHLTQELDYGGVTIRSLTGYSDTDNGAVVDLDGTGLPLLGFGAPHQGSRVYSQEIQILSDPSERFSWILGASYFDSKDVFDPLFVDLTVASQAFGLFAQQFSNNVMDTEAFAGYLKGDYDVSDRLTISAGARWTSEERGIRESTLWFEGIPNPSPLFDCQFAGLTFGVDCGGAALGLPEIPPAFAGAGSTLNGVRQIIPADDTTWKEWTYQASIQYAVNDNITVYYSHSRGFKSGVYNTPVLAVGGPNDPVNPEFLDSNEIGMKGDFLDGSLRINVAAFIYDLQDQQSQVVEGAVVTLASAGDSSLKGAEAEFIWAATDQLQLSGNIALLDGEYDDFPNFPAATPTVPGGGTTGAGGNLEIPVDVSGGDMIRTPSVTTNLVATYTMPMQELGLDGSLSLTGMWSYKDDYCWYADCRRKNPSYHMLNATVSYTTADERWKVTVWGSNLLDEDYYRNLFTTGAGDTGTFSRPAHGGVRLEYSF